MAHSLVLARFSPVLTARNYGMRPTVVSAASSISCRPFLALTIDLREGHAGRLGDYNVVLFPISPNRPSGEYYATVSLPPTKQTKFLQLGRPSQPDVLYIHTVPALYLKSGPTSNTLPYQFEPQSLKQLRILGKEDQRSWLVAEIQRRNSGGQETVQATWDTWSRGNLYEPQGHYGPLVVEFLDPDGIDLGNIPPPHVVEELMIFKKLALDYDRNRVGDLIAWCRAARELPSTVDVGECRARQPNLNGETKEQLNALSSTAWRRGARKLPSTVNVSRCRTRQLSLNDETKEQLNALYHMRIPVDRRPITDDDEYGIERTDDPIGHLGMPDSPIPFTNIRIVVFDSIGSIFDRQTPVLRALRSLDLRGIGKLEPEDVLRVYIDAESLLLQDNSEWDLRRVVEGALKVSLCRLGILNQHDPALLKRACEDVLRLQLYPDVEKALGELSSQGITIVGLTVPDASSFVLPHLPPPFIFDSFLQDRHALLQTPRELFSTLFGRLQSIRGDLEGKEQVLVVTTGRFRVLERANDAGYPTALIQHNLESRVDLFPTHLPTIIIPGGLKELKEHMITFTGDRTTRGTKVYAVRAGLYQGYNLLGSGGFGEVRAGVHVLTGAPVAIKYDSPEDTPRPHVCETNKYPCAPPYEAQVYRVLAGEPGFPSLRWYGEKDGVHVLVLDKLGPDLDAVRQLCRGRLSLKTVLMLGLQMCVHVQLERVEFVHSRGLILRDIKPQNFVMGLNERSSMVHLLDFGLVRPYINPTTNEHIPFVENLERVGTGRFSSYNMLVKRETSRRDDIESLGYVLLFLLRGRLPWQGIYAPSVEAKFDRVCEMRVGGAMRDYIDASPGRDLWHAWFQHCRDLGFADKPDYDGLRDRMIKQLEAEGGAADGQFDWLDGTRLEYGTLVPGEYKLDASLFHDDFLMSNLVPLGCQYYEDL